MSDYFNVTTNNGDAAIATAIANNTKLNITHIAFGDGNGAVPTPSKARTTLVNEVHRQAITKYSIHPTIANWLIVEAIIPSDVGGFWIREIGLIADGILISHGSHSPFYKVAETNGVSEFRLKYTINIQDGGVVNLTLDESLIYATQAWVDENYVPRDEIVDNLTTDDATKPVSAKQSKALQDNKLDKTANAVSASKWQSSRTVSFSGAATGSFAMDGSANASCILTLATSGVTAGTYASTIQIPSITVNDKGQITGISQQAIRSASVSQTGVVQLNNTLTSSATDQALTAAQGKSLQDNKLDKTSNAVSATKLNNARAINGVDFDGTSDISVPSLVTSISEGSDLNYVNAVGFYRCGSNTLAQTMLNCPTTNAFSLLVEYAAGAVQTLTEYMNSGTPKTYKRHHYNGTWGAWYQILSTLNADSTKLPLTGGTVSGPINLTGGGGSDVSNGIAGGNGDGASGSTYNLALKSWYGIGFVNYSTAGSVAQYTAGVYINVREGFIYSNGFKGNADSATKLATARTISLTGAAQGLATFDGSGNISISTTGLGVSQTWQNLTASRSSNTNYTNSTGKPIQISISVNDSGSSNVGVSITINSIIVLQTSDISSHGNTYSAIVPAGATYNVNANNNPIAVWAELR